MDINSSKTFYRKNDIGVDIEYTIVANYKTDERDYIIYTDFVSDEKDFVRLFVDMVNGDKYTPLSESGREEILNKFRNELGGYLSNILEKE